MTLPHLYFQTDSQDIAQFREDLGLQDPQYDDISAVIFLMDDDDVRDAWIYTGSRPFDVRGEFEALRAAGRNLPEKLRFYTKSPEIDAYFEGLFHTPEEYDTLRTDMKILAASGLVLRQRDPNILASESGRFMVVDGNGGADLNAGLCFVGDVASTLMERAKDMIYSLRPGN